MSLKVHPTIGIYDLSFGAAVKSLIKDGFISTEFIDGLYTDSADYYTEEGMSMEEAKATIHEKYSPWVLLCRTGTVTCIKLEACSIVEDGDILYSSKGPTRNCMYNPNIWYGNTTLMQLQQKHADKSFVSVCHRDCKGVLELLGYVIINR